MPDVIAGDLDSVRGDVLAHYQRCGVPVKDFSADQVRVLPPPSPVMAPFFHTGWNHDIR